MNDKIKNELIRRYMYLYENKDIILSLAINKGIEKNEIKECLDSLKRLKRTCRTDDMKDLVKVGISDCKKALKEDKYYLFKDIDDSLIDIFYEFLFADLDITSMELYKIIENVKNNKLLYDSCMMKINCLLDRRRTNRFLCYNNPFTVWKILTYVRNRYFYDKNVVDALDRYYNIERYILTGGDFKSGYIFLESDEDVYDNSLNKLPYNMIVGGVRTTYECSGIMIKYEGNEFEFEDDYFVYNWIEDIKYWDTDNNIYTNFMDGLLSIENLSLEDKESIYKELCLSNSKTLKRVNN